MIVVLPIYSNAAHSGSRSRSRSPDRRERSYSPARKRARSRSQSSYNRHSSRRYSRSRSREDYGRRRSRSTSRSRSRERARQYGRSPGQYRSRSPQEYGQAGVDPDTEKFIRTVALKVKDNGEKFEDLLRDRERQNSLFKFLFDTSVRIT